MQLFSAAILPLPSTGRDTGHIFPCREGRVLPDSSDACPQCIGNPLLWLQNIESSPAILLWSCCQGPSFAAFVSGHRLPLPAASEGNSNRLFLRVRPQIYTTGQLSRFPHPAHKTHGMAAHLHPGNNQNQNTPL